MRYALTYAYVVGLELAYARASLSNDGGLE